MQFGLWLNIERAQSRAAVAISNGFKLAKGDAMSPEFFEHLTDRSDQATLIHFRRGAANG